MIKRNTPGNGDPCVVTFTLPAEEHPGERVSVVGDFNDWDPAAAPLRKRNGHLSTALTLEPGRRYRFRYLTDQGQWFNDHAADDYEHNQFGGQDSVLDLTPVAVSV